MFANLEYFKVNPESSRRAYLSGGVELLKFQSEVISDHAKNMVHAIDSESRRLDETHPRFKSLFHWCRAVYFGDILPHLKGLKQYFKRPPLPTWSNYQLWIFVSQVYLVELDYRVNQWKKGNRQHLSLHNLVFRDPKDFIPGNWHRFADFWMPFITYMP